MRNFGALLTNEWLKLYKKKSFFVYFAVMAVFTGICAYVAYRGWLDGVDSALGFTKEIVTMSTAGQILPLVAIIAIANIVPQEFRMGTIKLLLIRAQSRSKILASKYIITLLFSFALIAATLVMALLAGLLLYGFGGDAGFWSSVGENVLYLTVYTFVFVTLTFMVGVLTKTSGATVGISMFCVMLGGLFTLLLSRYDFVKYVLFPNTDLSVYKAGMMPEDMTMTFSAVVVGVYMIIFLFVSFATFRKRDIS